MSEFSVRWDKLKSNGENISLYKSTLQTYSNKISKIAKKLPMTSQATETIRENLKSRSRSVSNLADKMGNMGKTLESAADVYYNTEKQLLRNTPSVLNAIRKFGLITVVPPGINYVLYRNMFSKSGGFHFTTGATRATGIVSASDKVLKASEKIYNLYVNDKKIKKLSKMLPKETNKIRWKHLLGFNDIYAGKASKAKSWKTRLYNNSKKIDNIFDDYKAGGSKSLFAWAGLALSAAGNSISNYQEMKSGKISGGRAVAETVTETVVDAATDWAIGAAVTVGIATVFGSAPVLAVAAVSAGVGFGLDFACKKITGAVTGEEKGLTETISDAVLNVGEAAVKGAKKVFSNISSKIKNGLSAVTNSSGRGFASLFA